MKYFIKKWILKVLVSVFITVTLVSIHQAYADVQDVLPRIPEAAQLGGARGVVVPKVFDLPNDQNSASVGLVEPLQVFVIPRLGFKGDTPLPFAVVNADSPIFQNNLAGPEYARINEILNPITDISSSVVSGPYFFNNDGHGNYSQFVKVGRRLDASGNSVSRVRVAYPIRPYPFVERFEIKSPSDFENVARDNWVYFPENSVIPVSDGKAMLRSNNPDRSLLPNEGDGLWSRPYYSVSMGIYEKYSFSAVLAQGGDVDFAKNRAGYCLTERPDCQQNPDGYHVSGGNLFFMGFVYSGEGSESLGSGGLIGQNVMAGLFYQDMTQEWTLMVAQDFNGNGVLQKSWSENGHWWETFAGREINVVVESHRTEGWGGGSRYFYME